MGNTNKRTVAGLLALLTLVSAATQGSDPGALDGLDVQPVTTAISGPAEAIIGAQSDGHRAACWGCVAIAVVTAGTGFGGVLAIGCGFICGKLALGRW